MKTHTSILRRATQIALIVSLIGLWLFANTQQAHACSCVPPAPPSEALAKSAAVFAGKVTSVREFQDPNATTYSSNDPTTVEFQVDTVWKGPSYGTMSLTTARSGASCGFTFVEGEEYVVYSRDGATVSLCSRTRSIANAQEDFDEHGEGQRPEPGSSAPTPEPQGGTDTAGSSAPTPEPQGGTDTAVSCGLSPSAGLVPRDASAVALMAGLIWLGLRRRPPG